METGTADVLNAGLHSDTCRVPALVRSAALCSPVQRLGHGDEIDALAGQVLSQKLGGGADVANVGALQAGGGRAQGTWWVGTRARATGSGTGAPARHLCRAPWAALNPTSESLTWIAWSSWCCEGSMPITRPYVRASSTATRPGPQPAEQQTRTRTRSSEQRWRWRGSPGAQQALQQQPPSSKQHISNTLPLHKPPTDVDRELLAALPGGAAQRGGGKLEDALVDLWR